MNLAVSEAPEVGCDDVVVVVEGERSEENLAQPSAATAEPYIGVR